MRGENAGVLDAMSDVSDSSDSDVELLHVMNPSDPRAHRAAPLAVQPTRQQRKQARNQTASRWDSDDDVGEPISVDSDSGENQRNEIPAVIANDDGKKKPTLSKWAARFLVPATQRKLPVLEEPPLEPLNDFILSDFGSRFRGDAGDVDVEKKIKEDEQQHENKNQNDVGVPLFEAKDKESDKDKQDTDKKRKKDPAEIRKRKENRYFITDLATKCFHCGQVGHMSNVCMNDKLQRPCYYCALRGHQAWECPNLPCTNCLQLGHQERDCDNRSKQLDPCSICGCVGHYADNCENVDSQELLTCMVCTTAGHLHCVPVPPPADRRVYCPQCAKNHTLDNCKDYREPAATNFATRTSSGRTVQTCFVCNEPGHIAAECPMRTNGYNRGRGGNCFKCGKPGHFAADCYNSNSSSNDHRVTGRKRGRNVEDEYPDYNGYNYDEDEGYYRSSKGGKKNRSKGGGASRSRKSSSNQGYARLNEALPTRPHRNNNNSYGDRRHNTRR